MTSTQPAEAEEQLNPYDLIGGEAAVRRIVNRFYDIMDSAPEAAACGYELLLAGHTHGGQLAVPFVGPLVTNSAMPRRAAAFVPAMIAAGVASPIAHGHATMSTAAA